MHGLGKPSLLLGALLLGLAACTTALPPEKTAAMGPPLPFNEQLKEGYLQLAEAQRAETHPINWYHFRSKAREAVIGDAVWPDKVASRQVPQASQAEAIELRERLLRALEGGARTAAPADAAAAQVNFDCWLQELETIKNPANFSDCKNTFLAALGKAESALIHTPYVVLFDQGSDRLDPDARNMVTRALWGAEIARPRQIAVTGFADSAGEARADQAALSQRRAEAVADALRAGKPPGSEIRVAAGGANPGTTGQPARRVEITFGG
jgi:outer membrane protein OmpA-like peptidoglycan-associated protein